MHDRIIRTLEESHAEYRLVDHRAEGNSERVALLRQTSVAQGAKAMVCVIENTDIQVMCVIPGDRRVDLKRVARHFGHKRARFMDLARAELVTGCISGAIPPFTFDTQLHLLVDKSLTEVFTEIAFNAGRLDKSVILSTVDYLRIAAPTLVDISTTPD